MERHATLSSMTTITIPEVELSLDQLLANGRESELSRLAVER